MRKIVFLLMLLISLIACGKPINDVYSFEDIPIQVDSYKAARLHLFGKLHNNNGVVTDVYCGETYDRYDGVCATCIPDAKLLNCEHTWPQSKFGNSYKPMKKVDLHHLFPSASFANSARGNLPFGEVNGDIVCGTAKRGRIIGTNILGFEPPDSHKGNVARAMFYFSSRYSMPIDSVQESYFRKWNRLDPIDSEERTRNRTIEQIQGWSNPFIDNPYLADQVRDF